MVYETKTKKLCHELSEYGKGLYQEMIAKEADKILVNNSHKSIAFITWVLEVLGFENTYILRKYLALLAEIKKARS